MKSKRQSTKTSAFGSPGRVSHDARAFYGSRLFAGIEEGGPVDYGENPVPPEVLNKILLKSSEDMGELPEGSVHLMVTSPPYNVGKEYDEDLTLEEYLAFLKRVWAEVHRVLVPGGRACINVANLGRKPYLPLHAFIIRDMLDLGFLMRGEVIWDKGASAAASTAWGSWKSPANPTLRDVHEYILIFSKGAFARPKPRDRESTITREEFLEFTRSVWSFPAESARKVGHPAPFPVELPYRCLKLYTYGGEVVLDPFMGSGSTALAALKAGRRYVGYELDPEYVKLTEKRLQDFVGRELAPTLFDGQNLVAEGNP
jgi:site-specific DNA-methyltransferase (adenine-specific)